MRERLSIILFQINSGIQTSNHSVTKVTDYTSSYDIYYIWLQNIMVSVTLLSLSLFSLTFLISSESNFILFDLMKSSKIMRFHSSTNVTFFLV